MSSQLSAPPVLAQTRWQCTSNEAIVSRAPYREKTEAILTQVSKLSSCSAPLAGRLFLAEFVDEVFDLIKMAADFFNGRPLSSASGLRCQNGLLVGQLGLAFGQLLLQALNDGAMHLADAAFGKIQCGPDFLHR